MNRLYECFFFFYSALRTFPERGGPPLSPPGLDSLGGQLCHSAAPGTHRCPVPSLLRPWWCRQWETQWLQVSGLVATKVCRLSILTIIINNNVYLKWAKLKVYFFLISRSIHFSYGVSHTCNTGSGLSQGLCCLGVCSGLKWRQIGAGNNNRI